MFWENKNILPMRRQLFVSLHTRSKCRSYQCGRTYRGSHGRTPKTGRRTHTAKHSTHYGSHSRTPKTGRRTHTAKHSTHDCTRGTHKEKWGFKKQLPRRKGKQKERSRSCAVQGFCKEFPSSYRGREEAISSKFVHIVWCWDAKSSTSNGAIAVTQWRSSQAQSTRQKVIHISIKQY